MALRGRLLKWIALLPCLLAAGCDAEAITSGFKNDPEVFREDVGFDVHFCMRVAASPTEIEGFLVKHFAKAERLAVTLDTYAHWCGGAFWNTDATDTVAYKKWLTKGGGEYGSTGVVVKDGTLYYWDMSL